MDVSCLCGVCDTFSGFRELEGYDGGWKENWKSQGELALSSVAAGLSKEGVSLVLAANEPEVLLTQ